MNILIVTFIISFIGSIHPGPLNVSVITITLEKKLKLGLIMALGGVVPELAYSWLAAEGVMFFQRNQLVFSILRWLLVLILFYMALSSIYAKQKEVKQKEINAKVFLKGFILSSLNPQLLIFWLLVVIYYQGVSYLHLKNSLDKVFFVIGAISGAFALNYLYASWAFSKKDFIFKHINHKIFNLIIGLSFIFMAMFQVYKLIFE